PKPSARRPWASKAGPCRRKAAASSERITARSARGAPFLLASQQWSRWMSAKGGKRTLASRRPDKSAAPPDVRRGRSPINVGDRRLLPDHLVARGRADFQVFKPDHHRPVRRR